MDAHLKCCHVQILIHSKERVLPISILLKIAVHFGKCCTHFTQAKGQNQTEIFFTQKYC
jgi:hypothetical protein